MDRLKHIEPEIAEFRSLGGGRIRLRFRHGPWVEVDLGFAIAIGNMGARLAEDDYLAQARIGDYGHWLEWPGELDFGADQLWEWGTPLETQPVGSGEHIDQQN